MLWSKGVDMEILLLHTDQELVNNIKYSFERDGDRIFIDDSLESSLAKLEKLKVDLILMGNVLKDGEIPQAIKTVKESFSIPIIVLSEDSQAKTAVLSLEYGAEDFMAYPIDFLELKARIRALKRIIKSSTSEEAYTLKRGPMNLDLIKHEISLKGISIALTSKEFELLFLLSGNMGTIFSRQMLAEDLWPGQGDASLRTVDVYVRRLREKLADLGLDSLIETRWRQGYIFNYIDDKETAQQ